MDVSCQHDWHSPPHRQNLVRRAIGGNARWWTRSLAILVTSVIMAIAGGRPSAGTGIVQGDFNGDGLPDLAIGVPRDDVTVTSLSSIEPRPQTVEITDAGSVHMIFGHLEFGLRSRNNQVWNLGNVFSAPSVVEPETSDRFGTALAAGDFDADGVSDLAIGVPLKDVPLKDPLDNAFRAGIVVVLYGVKNIGLTSARTTLLNQFSGDQFTGETPERSDWFGWSLTSGDFNGDGVSDLAVGAPGETLLVKRNGTTSEIPKAGELIVFYGAQGTGFTDTSQAQVLNQATRGVQTLAEIDDRFGSVITSGNFNGDRFSDLAIGVHGEDLGNDKPNVGVVHVIFGSSSLLNPTDATLPAQAFFGKRQRFARFGSALAAGDFDADGIQDLAIGAPREDVLGVGGVRVANAGVVRVLYGSGSGINATRQQIIDQGNPFCNICNDVRAPDPDGMEEGDRFGSALAAGDFDTDGIQDLAIGVVGENIRDYHGTCFLIIPHYTDHFDAGAVNIVRGSKPNGLTSTGAQFLHQSGVARGVSTHRPCCMGKNQLFGSSLAAWNFGRGNATDLAVGVPNDFLSDRAFHSCCWHEFCTRQEGGRSLGEGLGSVEVLYGPLDLGSPRNRKWSQNAGGIRGVIELPGTAQQGDGFGSAVY